MVKMRTPNVHREQAVEEAVLEVETEEAHVEVPGVVQVEVVALLQKVVNPLKTVKLLSNPQQLQEEVEAEELNYRKPM